MAKGDIMSGKLRHRLEAAVPLPSLLRKLVQISRRLWVRVLLIAALAVAAVGLAGIAGPLLPEEVPRIVGAEALFEIDVFQSVQKRIDVQSFAVPFEVERAAAND